MALIRSAASLIPAVLLLGLIVPESGAQSEPARPDASEVRALCWRGKPASHCRSFVLTEVALLKAISSTRTPFGPEPWTELHQDLESRLSLGLGPMVNWGPRSAIGGVVVFSIPRSGGDPGPSSAEVRYRHWLTPSHGADLSLGIAQMAVWVTPDDQRTARGITAATAITLGDRFGATARVDWLNDGETDRRAAFAGVQFGSQAAPVAVAALILVFYAALATAQ